MNNQNESLEQASVKQYCKAVRTPAIAANFVSLADQAVKENHSHVQYLEALLALECEERDRHAIANRIRDAQLPDRSNEGTGLCFDCGGAMKTRRGLRSNGEVDVGPGHIPYAGKRGQLPLRRAIEPSRLVNTVR